jgi:hypothetical protein
MLVARDAAASGSPLDPDRPSPEIQAMGMAVVAFPVACGDRTVTPAGIAIVPRQGQPPRPLGEPVSGADIARIVPGYAAPDGSMAATFALDKPRPIDAIRISYATELCDGTTREVTLPPPLQTPAKPVDLTPPAFPEGAERTEGPVWVQVVVDLNGTFQQPAVIGGPAWLREAALETVRKWKAEPARQNGMPVVSDTLLIVKFR